MKNCFILGSGRSGTSMLSGILHDAGYYMGSQLYTPNPYNPKGYYEDFSINLTNEEILANYDRPPWYFYANFINAKHVNHLLLFNCFPFFFKKLFESTVYYPSNLQRWLMSIPVHIDVTNQKRNINNRIRLFLEKKPFAYKDPRFSYTLPIWQDLAIDDIVKICVFREPNVTVKSILKVCATAKYLRNFRIDKQQAYEVWINIYSHILSKHLKEYPEIIFIHYAQIYDGSKLPLLAKNLGVSLSHAFVSRELKRTISVEKTPEPANQIYKKLCCLAGFNEDN